MDNPINVFLAKLIKRFQTPMWLQYMVMISDEFYNDLCGHNFITHMQENNDHVKKAVIHGDKIAVRRAVILEFWKLQNANNKQQIRIEAKQWHIDFDLNNVKEILADNHLLNDRRG
jgi:hypothetical protein